LANSTNVAASVKAKLKNLAKENGRDLNFLLTKYALERFLYRLSISEYQAHFLLKGALLFDLWYDFPLRPTRDIDLLGFGLIEAAELMGVLGNLCDLPVEDGMLFNRTSIVVNEIRKHSNYSGLRATFDGLIGNSRVIVQVDVGYGDAVTPASELVEYPVLLKEYPAPKLNAYPRYTVVSEKLEAMVTLGLANSRMKDYFDVWVILKDSSLDTEILSDAFKATTARRKTIMPVGIPLALSEEFSSDSQKNIQWNTFLKKNQLADLNLTTIVANLRDRLSYLF
jgi:predicted nucleotidyltransferase component of viral defense system